MSREENLNLQKNNILFLDNLDEPIYRVYTIERLLQVFIESKNALVKPSLWDDPFENFLLKSTAKNSKGEKIYFNSIREKIYGQCWTLNKDETDALWRIYTQSKNGVRVKTTIRKLFDSLFNPDDDFALIKYFVGRVKYYQETEIRDAFESKPVDGEILFDNSGKNIIKTMLFKRTEFLHENEVRIIFMSPEGQNKDSVYKYDFDAYDILDEILFDPRMEEGLFTTYSALLKKLGFNKTINQSSLYKFRALDIKLDI